MNRPLSMTAFGRGEASGGGKSWTVELRSVNHRFCDIKIKLPRSLGAIEERVKKMVADAFSRGHIEVMVSLGGESGEQMRLSANLPLAREYYQCLLAIRDDLGLSDAPSLALMANYRDLIGATEREEDVEAVWATLRLAVGAALAEANRMRANEGASLKKELLQRLATFRATLQEIEALTPTLIAKRQATLQERLATLLHGVELDPARLAQEVAIMADKSDVTEELVRLHSHIDQFLGFMELDDQIGRRLDFLLQEFLREINTLASKINDAGLMHITVELKNEVEKLREQVQNLE